MKKYIYYSQGLQQKIELELEDVQSILKTVRMINALSLTTHLHIITKLWKEKDIPFTVEEGREILETWGIDHELEVKTQFLNLKEKSDFAYQHLASQCENCGHPRGWHFRDTKCCDSHCDCEHHEFK